MGVFIWIGVFLILTNYLGIPFFRALFTTFVILVVWGYLLHGEIYLLVIFLLCAVSAMVVWGDGNELDVRGKFWFSLLSFFFPFIGVPLYFLLRKKLSKKLGDVIKSEAGEIQFINR